MQKVRRYFFIKKAPTDYKHSISGIFFTPYLGVFFTFPSRY